MKDITFVDLEVTLNTCRVVDIGAVRSDRTLFHENSFDNLLLFLHQVPYIGGHNILKHDLSYLKPQFEKAGCRQPKIIDTLYLSRCCSRKNCIINCPRMISYRLINPITR